MFALSFFWFAWTSFPHLSYWGPMLSGFPMRFSIQLIFLGLSNYVIDVPRLCPWTGRVLCRRQIFVLPPFCVAKLEWELECISVAASALASLTVIRSMFGAAFLLFADNMYEALNPRWASSVLGFIAILMIPIPFILKRYGPLLRKRSRFCPSYEDDEDERGASTTTK
ncbi:hypothetical protein CPB84DRAFT_495877 [Gymnopilus junonius]|uniref:Uncharacterized protein n=1 Tax=Gymnopilus junonius TaxID=109634 RepID=A0A9P5P220_GYMJU|nr:hypothetical protein CPB84DRAFT_495877 [Gymnopilus junonius]